jgi:hypothetical protein
MINRFARIASSAARIAVEDNLDVDWEEEEDSLGGTLVADSALLLGSTVLDSAPN